MAILNDFDTSRLISPLQPRLHELVTSFRRLSPRSCDVANRAVEARGIDFDLDEKTTSFLCEARAFQTDDGIAGSRFVLGLRTIERTWAAVFGYMVLFRWTADRHNAGKGHKVPMPDALTEAVSLLSWAFSNRHNLEDYLWPNELPSPSNPYKDGDLMARANATAVRVTGWMLLHELGHFERMHFEPAPNTEAKHPFLEEHEADAWASELSINPLNCDHTRANLVSVPFGLGILAGINHREDDEHPALTKRLLRYYETFVEPQAKVHGALFNTALYATTTPLLAQLYLRKWNPSGFQPLPTLREFLPWWEAEMEGLEGTPDMA